LKNLESACEAKRHDFSMDAEQEVSVLSTDTTEEQGFIPSAQRELVEEGGEVSEGISGQRSELRNVVDGSSSDDCGNDAGNGSDVEGKGSGSGGDEGADYKVTQEDTKSVYSEWLCMQPVGVGRMMAIIMMDTLKSELGLAHMKAAEISGSVVGCSEHTVWQWYVDVFSSKDVALKGCGTWQRNNVTSDEKISKKLVDWLRVETVKRNYPELAESDEVGE